MVRFEPFRAEHLLAVTPQHEQFVERDLVQLQHGRLLEQDLSFSCWADGECICCAGVVMLHPQRGFVWALLSGNARRHLVALTRFSRQVFDEHPARRLEMTVAPEFRMARRWAEMLGFDYEASLEAYDELGREVLMYKRIRR